MTEFARIVLERFQICANRRVSKMLLHDAQINQRDLAENIGGTLELNLHGWLFGEHAMAKTIRWPVDWLEAVKERFAPAWLVARWPVRYNTLTLDAWRVFPSATLKVPDTLGQPVIVPIWSESRYDAEASTFLTTRRADHSELRSERCRP